ncbi:hypothetical protein [Promicromonospora sp. NPDC057488]|uniref:hypothetical protein n=1 Tax=Promicromonospora sp. NPDC057488 TaxID=3346147 RepID=UPI00366E8873
MRHATILVAVLATVAIVTGCSAQPPATTAPTPSATASPSPTPESSEPAELDRCSEFTAKAEKLLGSRVVKRDDRALADGIEACWWQTDYTGYVAALTGPAPLDFVAVLDDTYDEPTAWHRETDSPMWATGQGIGGQASWTSKDESVQTGIVARGIDNDRLMDLMSLAAEIAQA